MSQELYGFSDKATADKLKQIAQSWDSQTTGPLMPPGNKVGLWVMQATGLIGKVTTNNTYSPPRQIPGIGQAKVCWRDPSDNSVTPYGSNPLVATVFNLAVEEDIPAGTYFFGFRDLAGTLWVWSLTKATQCVTVVTKVDFDHAKCKLVVCTRQLCFPPGVKIGTEDCGGSGSGG